MLIQLTKKIKLYYKIKLEDLPPGVFTPEAWKAEIYKQIFMYEADWIANLNVQTEIVNVKSVKCFSVFNHDEEYRNVKGREYLKGANTKVIFNDGSIIFVTEKIPEIVSKTGAK
jgi:hypothetical protein